MSAMRLVRACAVATVLATVTSFVVAGVAGAQAEPSARPTVVLSSNVLVPGTSVNLTGKDWPIGTSLTAQVCGNAALDAGIDCVQSAAVVMIVGPGGALDYQLPVFAPPRPCPCVVLVSPRDDPSSIVIPVQIVGVATAPVNREAPVALPQTVHLNVRVLRVSSWTAVFGASTPRTLVIEVHNDGHSTVMGPTLVARLGRGTGGHHVISAPDIDPIPAGQSRTIVVPFKLDAFSFGRYTVAGQLTGPANPAIFAGHTSTWPWGLMIVLGLLAVAAAVLVWRRVRKDHAGSAELPTDQAQADLIATPETAPEKVTVA